MTKLDNQWFEHATGNVACIFFVSDKVASGDWQVVVQKETHSWHVVVEVLDLTIGTYIDGVFMDMHAVDAIRGVIGIKEGE